MSFVAEAVGGKGKGYWRGVCEGTGGRGWREKVHPGNPRAPPRTRIKCCEIQIINDNEKKSDGHFTENKRTMSVQAHPSTGLKEERNKDHTGLRGQQPGGPSKPISRRWGAVSRPPGPSHPSRRSARENPSPSARQRGRQPTNPGRPPRISTDSAAPRLDARFARRLPSPVQTNTPARKWLHFRPWPRPLVQSEGPPRPLESARENLRPQSSHLPGGTSVHAQRLFQRVLAAAGYSGNLVVFSLGDQSGAGPMSLQPPIFQEWWNAVKLGTEEVPDEVLGFGLN